MVAITVQVTALLPMLSLKMTHQNCASGSLLNNIKQTKAKQKETSHRMLSTEEVFDGNFNSYSPAK